MVGRCSVSRVVGMRGSRVRHRRLRGQRNRCARVGRVHGPGRCPCTRRRVDDRVTLPYADTVVTEAEEAIGPVDESFGVVDPPDPSLDELRSDVLDQLAETGDLLADARIAVRRGDSDAMVRLAGDLRRVADAMDQHAEALQ